MPIEALCILSAILLIGVLWFAYGIWKAGRRSKQLQARGTTTTATVIQRKTGYDSSVQRPSYILTLSYAANDTTYQSDVRVTIKTYGDFPEGSTIAVVYMPDNPKDVELKGRY